MNAVGTAFRNRYMPASQSQPDTSTAIYGLSTNSINPQDLYILALDQQFATASAQSFMQALYPPNSRSNGTDPASTLANGTYVPFPLDGYQFPWIHTASDTDADSVFMDGADDCPNFNSALQAQGKSESMQHKVDAAQHVYFSVGSILADDTLSMDLYSYSDADTVYDYLSYQNTHNSRFNSLLNNGSSIPAGDFDQLRYYSDQYTWQVYGNPDSASSGNSNTQNLNTIAGQTFMYALEDRLDVSASSEGESGKLSLFFGEYEIMTSFFSLVGLPSLNSDFLGVPNFGSSMVFELFTNTSTPASSSSESLEYPDVDELRLRFLFRNGSDAELINYPLFGAMSLPASDFMDRLSDVSIDSVADWCQRCDAWTSSSFCLNYNSTARSAALGSHPSSGPTTQLKGQMAPALAGVIGAIVTLAVVALILVVAVCVFGLRFRRVVRQKKSKNSLGGFKGGQKLESDPDVHIIKDKSGVGITAEATGDSSSDAKGHQRFGSWEMNNAGLTRPKSTSKASDEIDRFGSGALGKEVRPDDRV